MIMAISGSFDMTSPYDDQYRSQGMGEIVDAIQQDRLSMLRTDAFRSLIFIALTAVLVYFAFLKKVKFSSLVILLSLLVLVDLWPVNKRYLNSKDFVTKKEDKNPFKPSTADLLILKDRDPNFKVLNMSLSPLQDASTSYFHKSLGGYHGAKMRRYQELFDHNIQNEMMDIINTLQKRPVPAAVDSTMATLNAINMLNTRYIIYNPDAPPLVNKHELGNAWFVKEFVTVPNADAEIAAIATFKPAEQAVVDQRFSSLLKDFKPVYDSTAKISLTEYRANYLKYSSSSQADQLAVFSEIYYDKGWEAFVDGKATPHFRADYLLRAMVIPAGSHTIEFRFHPKSYFIDEKISLASSILLVLLIAGMGYREWKKNAVKKAD